MYKCVHVQVTHACDLSVAFVFDLCVCVQMSLQEPVVCTDESDLCAQMRHMTCVYR